MMFKEFGKYIKSLRQSQNENITQVSEAIGIDRSYLSKLESGKLKPSKKIINLLFSHFSLSPVEAQNLFMLGGYNYQPIIAVDNSRTDQATQNDREEGKIMNNESVAVGQAAQAQVNVPGNLPILYTDSIFVTLSPYGIVFDVAQTVGPTNSQTVVSRIGMSIDHAEALLNVLGQKVTEAKLRQKKERASVKH